MATERQKELFAKNKPLYDLMKEISKDYNVPRQVASLAGYFLSAHLDLRDQSQVDLLKKKNPATGEYESFAGAKPEQFNKESIIDFLMRIISLADEKTPIYNFSGLCKEGGFIDSYTFEGDAIAYTTYKTKNAPDTAPRAVAKPSGFKKFCNNLFGFFKNDIQAYDEYVEKKAAYDAKVADDIKKKAVVDNNAALFENMSEQARAKKSVEDEIYAARTLEDNLRIDAEAQRRSERTMNVVSGKLNERLEFHENYQKLIETPLDEHPEVDMGGLALLAACSEKFNNGISDASTQLEIRGKMKGQLTKNEEKFMSLMKKASHRSNIGAKIVESVYGGGDNDRMGPRMKAVIEGRLALNSAMRDYLENGNKQPLADLLSDSLPALYGSVCNMISGYKSTSGKAIDNMMSAIDDLFKKDPELKGMVNFKDSKLQEMRGAARLSRYMTGQKIGKHDLYQLDKGPGTKEREKVAETILVNSIISNIVVKEAQGNINELSSLSIKKMNDPELQSFKDKFDFEGIMGVQTAMQTFFMEGYMKAPKIFSNFGKDDFDMAVFETNLAKEVRKLPQFDELVKMDKDVLFKKDFNMIGLEAAKKFTLELFKKPSEPEKAAGLNQESIQIGGI